MRRLSMWTAVLALTGALFVAHSDVHLLAKNVKRGCWVACSFDGLWIHCSSFNNYQGSNYDYLEWTFGGAGGTYELQINHVAHFSGKPMHYVTHNGKTVYGPKQAPISLTGWCCADRGSPCRATAKDNLALVKTGVRLTLKTGDKIRFYGNVHYGCDGHGNYSGIYEIIMAGGGTTGVADSRAGLGAAQWSISSLGQGIVTVRSPAEQAYTISLLDAAGACVKKIAGSGTSTFQLKGLVPPGVYIARISGSRVLVGSRRLVVNY